MSLHQKWLLTGKLMIAYCLLIPVIILLLFFFGRLDLVHYKLGHQEFYYPLNRFGDFFKMIFLGALREETYYRGPVWLLAVSGLSLILTSNLTAKQYNLRYLLFGLTVLIPNIYWIRGHSVLPWLVFLAGLGWGWLVYKTGSLWPAVVSHTIVNVLIYFGIKLAGLFIKI